MIKHAIPALIILCGIVVIAVLLLLTTGAQAAPIVLGGTGPTRSIVRYYETIAGNDSAKPQSEKTTLANSFSKALLPVRTPEMSPGPVVAREVDAKALDRPFFIIGSDLRSREWLANNHDRLVQLQAVGLLVQAETPADLRAIADLGVGIRIAPIPGSDLATRLGLKHYPVLISSGWVEQ